MAKLANSKDIGVILLNSNEAIRDQGESLADMQAFAQAIEQAVEQPAVTNEWVFHVSGMDVAEQVLDAGAQIATEVPANYAFISLRAA